MDPARMMGRLALASAGFVALLSACGGEREHGAAAPSASAPVVVHAPPQTSFAVVDDMPREPGKASPVPPEAALGPWRVWVNQERPRQKKNPHWQVFAARDGAELPMETGSTFRCIVTPVKATSRSEEDGSVEAWAVWRSVRCSSDGWATYAEAQLTVNVSPDGTREAGPEHAELFLREMQGGKPRETSVALRADGGPKKPPAAAPATSVPAAPSGSPAPSASAG